MNIRRKVFSSISEIEERAFSEGYNAALADDEDYRLYEQDEKDRKRKRRNGLVAGAAGTGLSLVHALGIHNLERHTETTPTIKKLVGMGLTTVPAAAGIGSALYIHNKKSNKSRTFEEYMQDQENKKDSDEGYKKALSNADIKRRMYDLEEEDKKKNRKDGRDLVKLGLGYGGLGGSAIIGWKDNEKWAAKGGVDTGTKWARRGLVSVPAAALVGTGLYKINKDSNKKRTFEEYMQEKENKK